MKIVLLSFLFLLAFVSCQRDTEYVIFEEPAAKIADIEIDSRVYPLEGLFSENKVDILFVIDNSGSMSAIQKNVADNAKIFIEKFAQNSIIDWKIGIISTDDKEDPYLGFKSPFGASLIDVADPNTFSSVVKQFAAAVNSLGTRGSAFELTFSNVIRALDEWQGLNSQHPKFHRKTAHLAVIMITDEEEQSGNFTVNEVLLNLEKRLYGGRQLRFYGAFDAGDLTGCRQSTYTLQYKNSRFEEAITQTNGFAFSACIEDFGGQLARVGEDIVSLIKLPSLVLRNRPIIKTIKIIYKGEELKPGNIKDGGYWYYDYNTNTINFYSIDFVDDILNDSIIIDFDVDDGIHRED